MEYVAIAAALTILLLTYSICVVSGWQSRREDARDGEAGES